MSAPVAAWLPGGRLHLQHGPIDLICTAEGPGRGAALAAAAARVQGLLDGLVAELPALRRPLGGTVFADPVARAMAAAVMPFRGVFVTPMAAVAGAVADAVLAAMVAAAPGLTKATVNNGGDVALHLGPGAAATAAVAAPLQARLRISASGPVRGVATSGRGGRSHSLGIADAVTVLARDAATADVAATLIANAVDLPGHPAVTRRPACELSPDSDLGARPVTVAVGPLAPAETACALDRGRRAADAWRARGLIAAACLVLGDRHLCVGAPDLIPQSLPEPAHA